MDSSFEVIIIGSGIMGSAAAYNLSKTGKKVLLLEQYSPQHSQGSSHGESRIIRKTYTENHFSELMKEAYQLWTDFENESKIKYIISTGGLDFGPEGSQNLKKTVEVSKQLQFPYSQLNNRQINEHYPALNLPANYYGIFQPDSGIILANQALTDFQTIAQKKGIAISYNETVNNIRIENDKITIKTSKDTYFSEKLILTPGRWLNDLLESTGIVIGLQIWKMSFAYWPVTDKTVYQQEKFPIFIAWEDKPIYGFPILEKPDTVKIAPHFSFEEAKKNEFSNRNPDSRIISYVGEYIKERFNHIKNEPVDSQVCYYTMTQDENFILDFHPDSDSCIIGGGFSGHGFKFAPLVGKILADLALKQSTIYNINPFKLSPYLKK